MNSDNNCVYIRVCFLDLFHQKPAGYKELLKIIACSEVNFEDQSCEHVKVSSGMCKFNNWTHGKTPEIKSP